ncbi:putative E3 ubiquitin-protein ligase DTX2 [Platysternon megacephalum]|uniref:Putative E3 ubiquitin-protein ligase DTX2 n=1 Tax=Platysternon megacephalum TaxID=55544 RepID=A0A4D9ERB2_9SAUR|nr:putative E3 ubiquitin-protein ligase DTX2 [Platysternon megacephalum]
MMNTQIIVARASSKKTEVQVCCCGDERRNNQKKGKETLENKNVHQRHARSQTRALRILTLAEETDGSSNIQVILWC